MPFVAVLMGSDSDFPVLEPALDMLDAFGIRYEVRLRSAHRTPAATHDYVHDAETRGCAVFIANAAGILSRDGALQETLRGR